MAYSTRDRRHRLNVPAAKMSAWPDRPEHFLSWLRRHVAVDFPAEAFAPRMPYGEYLRQTLDEAARSASGVTITHLPLRATDLLRQGARLRLTLDDGTTRVVDAAVLATGYGTPSTAWAPAALRRSPCFVADPWSADLDRDLRVGSEVVRVGAELTMSDMAVRWGRAGVRLHVVSRHGMLPLPHASSAAEPLPAPHVPADVCFDDLRRLLFERTRAAGGDWRAAVDGLRPVTASLWARLSQRERERFLTVGARRWERMRHRVDPSLHAWLDERCVGGTIAVHTGTVTVAHESAAGIDLELSDGSRITAAAVVNCTGAAADLLSSADPLTMNLLAAGLLRPDPLGLGAETDADGRITDDAAMWAIGPLRRGALWESTAVPEIREQAAALADNVLAVLPSARSARRVRDPYGLPPAAMPAAPSGTPRRPATPCSRAGWMASLVRMTRGDVRPYLDGLGAILAGTANVIMQLSRPPVGYGVLESPVESGQVIRHPIKRFRTTFTYLGVALLGTDAERAAYRSAVDGVHRQVRSTPDSPVRYHAMDPDLQLWVAACLYWGTADLYERMYGPLTESDADELYEHSARFATTLQVRPSMWPVDRVAFARYWDEALAEVSIDPPVRDYLMKLVTRAYLPFPFDRTARFSTFVTTGFLPQRFRDEMKLPWGPIDQARFDKLLRRLGAARRHLPVAVRVFPLNAFLFDLRRRVRDGRALV